MTSKLTREQLRERARENVKALKMASRQHAFESAREEILADLQLAEYALARLEGVDSEPVYQCEFTHAADSGELQWHWEDVNEAFYEQYGSGPRGQRRILYSVPQPTPQSGPVMDSEPVAEVVSIYGEGETTGEREIRPLVGIQQMPYGTKLYRHAQPAKSLELAGWQFKSVNGDWLGLIDEHGKNQAVREGCEVREVFAIADGVNDRDNVRREHAEWSQATFGSVGPVGPLKHLSKEALEAAAEPGDLSEWADMQFLLWDAQRRAGITDEQITQAMIEKLAVNKLREWQAPKDGEPRLHIKGQPVPDGFPPDEIECDICGHVSTDPEGRHHCCEDNSND